jgi:hypothetical protein
MSANARQDSGDGITISNHNSVYTSNFAGLCRNVEAASCSDKR